MTFPQLYVPQSGTPLFAAGAEVLVAGYTDTRGVMPPIRRAIGTLMDPWLPGQSPVFNHAGSTIEGIPLSREDRVRTVTLPFLHHSLQESRPRTVVSVRRAEGRVDEEGLAMYLIMEDLEGLHNEWHRFCGRFVEESNDSNAKFFGAFSRIEHGISNVAVDVRRRLILAHQGFLI